MKARLAKKIIKASDFYGLYSLECRGKRRKRYPYWFRRWSFVQVGCMPQRVQK